MNVGNSLYICFLFHGRSAQHAPGVIKIKNRAWYCMTSETSSIHQKYLTNIISASFYFRSKLASTALLFARVLFFVELEKKLATLEVLRW